MTAVEVNHWLQRRYGFQAPLDWLEACCAWLHEENNGLSLTPNELRSQVFDQWLLSDLREVCMKSLPENIVNQAKVVLEGSYCLQVNSVYDASSSFYSQLQKVQGTENENVQVSATQNSQSQSPQSGRLLMFEMTDGAQSIKGMEYRQIPGVDDNLTPGVKVIISGPVTCRHGVLMLMSHNWMLLGGEVDTLTANTKVNVLQRILTSNRERGPMEVLRQTFSIEEHSSLERGRNSQRCDSMRDKSSNVYKGFTVNAESDHQQNVDMVNDEVDDYLVSLDLSELDAWDDQMIQSVPTSLTSSGDVEEPQSIQGRNTVVQGTERNQDKATSGYRNEKQIPCKVNPSGHPEVMTWDIEEDDDFDSLVQTLSEPLEPDILSKVTDKGDISAAQCTNETTRQSLITGGSQQMINKRKEFFSDTAIAGHSKNQICDNVNHSSPFTLDSMPYTYLLLITHSMPFIHSLTVTVKAYVSTLLGPLEHNSGEFWSLAIKLNDGTASIDADLGDGLLTTLIGFTAAECHDMKQRAKLCSQTRQRIVQGIRACQQSIVQLCGLVQMKLGSDRQRPLVTSYKNIGEMEVNSLRRRLSVKR